MHPYHETALQDTVKWIFYHDVDEIFFALYRSKSMDIFMLYTDHHSDNHTNIVDAPVPRNGPTGYC